MAGGTHARCPRRDNLRRPVRRVAARGPVSRGRWRGAARARTGAAGVANMGGGVRPGARAGARGARACRPWRGLRRRQRVDRAAGRKGRVSKLRYFGGVVRAYMGLQQRPLHGRRDVSAVQRDCASCRIVRRAFTTVAAFRRRVGMAAPSCPSLS